MVSRGGKTVLILGALLALGAAGAHAAAPDGGCPPTASPAAVSAQARAALEGFDYEAAKLRYVCLAQVATGKAAHYADEAKAGLALVEVAEGHMPEGATALQTLSQAIDERGDSAPLEPTDYEIAAKSAYDAALFSTRIRGIAPYSTLWTQVLKRPRGTSLTAPAAFDQLDADQLDLKRTFERENISDAAFDASHLAFLGDLPDVRIKADMLAVDNGWLSVSDYEAQTVVTRDRVAATDANDLNALLVVADTAIGRALGARSAAPRLQLLLNARQALDTVLKAPADSLTQLRAAILDARLHVAGSDDAGALRILDDAAPLQLKSEDFVVSLEYSSERALILARDGRYDEAFVELEQATDYVQRARALVGRQLDVERRTALHQIMTATLNERAELMLSRHGDDPQALHEARRVLELAKLIDLEDFFSDPCLRLDAGEVSSLDDLAPDAAVLYPVVFDDHVEVILATRTDKTHPADVNIRRFRAARDLNAGALRLLAGRLETDLAQDNIDDYTPAAQQLYDQLLGAGGEDAFLKTHGIHTLVFAPNPALRGVPLAALVNPKTGQYVIQEGYSVATALGLSLVDPQPLVRNDLRLLRVGVPTGYETYPNLINVPKEMDQIAQSAASPAWVSDPTPARFSAAIDAVHPDILHVAAHGEFNRLADSSFVLLYQARLPIRDFAGTIRDVAGRRGIDLLVLSACYSAKGDDEALLGMAGIAYKAGARSVVGSLWEVKDNAAPDVFGVFYKALIVDKASKAEALRQAQLKLIGDGQSPKVWAPFIVLGNWM